MPFLRIEICKAVQEHILAPHIVRHFQIVTQLCHAIPGIQAGSAQPCFIGTVQQCQVMHLVSCRAIHLLCRFGQTLRRDFINAHLIKKIQHLLKKCRFPGWPLIYRQFRYHFPQRSLQRQQFTASVQRYLRSTTGNMQNPVTKTAKTQNLCMAAYTRTTATAQIDLH